MYAEKFIEPFIDFVEKNFDSSRHQFLVRQLSPFSTKPGPNVTLIKNSGNRIAQIFFYVAQFNRAEKIILHGLFDREILRMLFLQPWLLKKCYWVIWGGDLYYYPNRPRGFRSDLFEIIRTQVIRRMGHFVTYVKGDYELAKKWFGVQGEYHECLMYLSNLYKENVIPAKSGTAINILVGNSADPTNNHLEIFEKLHQYRDENVMIYCPLSYGPTEYAERMAKLGKEMFGDKFIPLLDFMPFEKYLELLGQIDIAVFAHRRQQAMGNTITLLGLGKKVAMRTDVTPWAMFSNLCVKVFDFHNLDLALLGDEVREENKLIIKNNFSEAALAKQWKAIFQG
jgi:hypothetical protein